MSISNERGKALFRRAGAFKEGHFRLQSGKDGLHYIAKDLLWQNDDSAMLEICREIAEDFAKYEIETVVGPESGAVKYAHYVAHYLSKITDKKVVSVRAIKCGENGKQFRFDDQDLPNIYGKKILIVEDVFTTGESALKVVTLVFKYSGNVVGVGGVWNRGGVTAKDLGVEVFISQINEQFSTFEPGPETCPGCRDEIPYDLNFGHGKDLVGKHPLAKAQ